LNLLSACISGSQALVKGDCMSTSKLPARPSLDSLRKQAKKLTRDIVAGEAAAIARARAQLPQAELPLSRRDAQLVLAREYGFPGWKDLAKEVEQRLGRGLEWAASEARRIIHDNDVDGLRQLLTEYPALLSWQADENDGGLLGMLALRNISRSWSRLAGRQGRFLFSMGRHGTAKVSTAPTGHADHCRVRSFRGVAGQVRTSPGG
jgi:hypothetical protein